MEITGKHRAAGLLITEKTTHPPRIHRDIQNTHFQLRSFNFHTWKHSYTLLSSFRIFSSGSTDCGCRTRGGVPSLPPIPRTSGSHPTLTGPVPDCLGRNRPLDGGYVWGSGSVTLLGSLHSSWCPGLSPSSSSTLLAVYWECREPSWLPVNADVLPWRGPTTPRTMRGGGPGKLAENQQQQMRSSKCLGNVFHHYYRLPHWTRWCPTSVSGLELHWEMIMCSFYLWAVCIYSII